MMKQLLTLLGLHRYIVQLHSKISELAETELPPPQVAYDGTIAFAFPLYDRLLPAGVRILPGVERIAILVVLTDDASNQDTLPVWCRDVNNFLSSGTVLHVPSENHVVWRDSLPICADVAETLAHLALALEATRNTLRHLHPNLLRVMAGELTVGEAVSVLHSEIVEGQISSTIIQQINETAEEI